MNNEKLIGEELIGLIRQIIREEINNILPQKVESIAKAQVVRNLGNGYCDVRIIETSKIISNLLNKTGLTLANGDFVKIYYSHNNYADGYIGYKY